MVGLAVVLYFGYQSRTNYIHHYCAYGAVSEAQLNGCLNHVTTSEVDDRKTPAAIFARSGGDAECGPGAGPLCPSELSTMQLEEEEPPPGQ